MKSSERLDICMVLTLALILALACLPSLHCREKQVNIEVPKYCIQSVKLLDCDDRVEPPKCKSAQVKWFPPSCAIVRVE